MHELIQSELQSDIISEKSLLLPAEVFRFRSVKYTPLPRETRYKQYKNNGVHEQRFKNIHVR